MWLSLILPLAINIITKVIESTDSKQDDKILDVVKIGASYLAVKDNNSLNYSMSKEIKKVKMK